MGGGGIGEASTFEDVSSYNKDLQCEGLNFVISCLPLAKPIIHADISRFC